MTTDAVVANLLLSVMSTADQLHGMTCSNNFKFPSSTQKETSVFKK